MRRRAAVRAAAALALCSACVEVPEQGGITARLVFAGAPRARALRAARVPDIVDRLQITALDVSGATLAETNLFASPGDEALALVREGGEWALEAVPAGRDRIVAARAYLGASVDPRLDRALAYLGERTGVEVTPGRTTDIGVLELHPAPLRIPEIDSDAPDPPNPVRAEAPPEGNALVIHFGLPRGDDLAGYVVALSTSSGALFPPRIERGRPLAEGEAIDGGFAIVRVVRSPEPTPVEVRGLANGDLHAFAVYAFDADVVGAPLNYSDPAAGFAVPKDVLPPGAPEGLAIRAAGGDRLAIEFVAPGEDGRADRSGAPLAYAVRASADRSALEDQERFLALSFVLPPPVAAPGTPVEFERTFRDLGAPRGAGFFVGVRATDADANDGPVAIARFEVETSTLPPAIRALVPEIAVASRELSILGENFGTETGTVGAAGGASFTITRWRPEEVVVLVPNDAASGTLRLTRLDGRTASIYLPVIQRFDAIAARVDPPFDLAAGQAADGTAIAALYEEVGRFAPFEGHVRRFFGATREEAIHAPLSSSTRSSAIAASYSPERDLFVFVASRTPLTMTTALVSGDAAAPLPSRIVEGVFAGGADSLAIHLLGGGTSGAAPALFAFSREGVIRTATVANVRVEPFTRFAAYTAPGTAFDRLRMAVDAEGEAMIAARATDGSGARLALFQSPTASMSGFASVPAPNAPAIGENLEILAIPARAGSSESFLVAYEALEAGGGTAIRLLRLEDLGLSTGYAPLPATQGAIRLEDVGLLVREGELWICVLASRLTPSAELVYAEVPLRALDVPTPEGSYPGAILDIAPASTRGRVGCKPKALGQCPIFWLGPNAAAFFLRR